MSTHPLYSKPEIRPDSKDLLKYLLSITPTEFDTLRKASQYYALNRFMRSNGLLNFLLGGLTLWLGLLGADQSTFKIIQTLAGMVIIGHSLWMLLRPAIPRILTFSILQLLSGSWNLFIAIFGGLAGDAFLAALLGIAQLWWAYQAYKDYQNYSNLLPIKPSAITSKLYDDIWYVLANAKLTDEDNFVDLRADWGDRSRFILLPDTVISLSQNRKAAFFASKSNFIFAPDNPKAKRQIKGRVKFDTVIFYVRAKRSTFDKYFGWKTDGGSKSDNLVDMPPRPKIERAARFIFLSIGVLVVLYLLFILIGSMIMISKYG